MTTRLGRVHAFYGMAETFWDIGFTPLQLAYANAEDEFKSTISVEVDVDTGRVALNNGYAPGTETYEQERRLFAKFRHAIDEALLGAVNDEDGEYAVFLKRARDEEEARAEALRELEERLSEVEVDDDDLIAA